MKQLFESLQAAINAIGADIKALYAKKIPTKVSELENDAGFVKTTDVHAQVQADWEESDASQPDFIKNKPVLDDVVLIDYVTVYNNAKK